MREHIDCEHIDAVCVMCGYSQGSSLTPFLLVVGAATAVQLLLLQGIHMCVGMCVCVFPPS